MANFIGLVYGTLKEKGIDTSNMSTEEAVAKFKELQGGSEKEKDTPEKIKEKLGGEKAPKEKAESEKSTVEEEKKDIPLWKMSKEEREQQKYVDLTSILRKKSFDRTDEEEAIMDEFDDEYSRGSNEEILDGELATSENRHTELKIRLITRNFIAEGNRDSVWNSHDQHEEFTVQEFYTLKKRI